MQSIASCGNATKQKSSPKEANRPQGRTFPGSSPPSETRFLHALTVGLARSRARPTVSVSSPASRTLQASKTRNVSNPMRNVGYTHRAPRSLGEATLRARRFRCGDTNVSAPRKISQTKKRSREIRGNVRRETKLLKTKVGIRWKNAPNSVF